MSLSFIGRCIQRVTTAATTSPFSLGGLGAIRTATKRAGGSVRNHGGSPGKRLGLKKFSDQYVIPGNIIIRQRGTQLHPGPHVKMGRDHTIYAVAPGVVRFYKEIHKQKERKFVGVVLQRGETLPRDLAGRGRSRYSPLLPCDPTVTGYTNLNTVIARATESHPVTTMSNNLSVTLSITPVKIDALPPYNEIIVAAQRVLDDTGSWKQGKAYKGVNTFSSPRGPLDGAPWHCRVSLHDQQEIKFDQLWDKLSKNKALNEKEFVPDIKKVTQITKLDEQQAVWSMLYKFPPPIAPRVFTVLQVVNETASPRSGIVVSIPVDLAGEELASLEEHGVRGRYVSIERVLELDNGMIEWRMATSSTPGGSIPNFIVESSMPSKIAEDVPHFFAYFKRGNAS